jgi:hypothetical protein
MAKNELFTDMLEEVFERQRKFMDELVMNDRLPEYPVDIRTKQGQRLIKETIFNMAEELFEASYTLKNRMHRLTDARDLDIDHYREELGDALAYFVEVCILSGITPIELYGEYCRKNQIVLDRIKEGY